VIFWVAILLTNNSIAEPFMLKEDSGTSGYIINAHQAIQHTLPSTNHIRAALLDATYNNKKLRWTFEEEGEDFLIVRWDYAKETIIVRIEYNNELIQIKYLDASEEYECEQAFQGICYQNNDDNYFEYVARLRKSIETKTHVYMD